MYGIYRTCLILLLMAVKVVTHHTCVLTVRKNEWNTQAVKYEMIGEDL